VGGVSRFLSVVSIGNNNNFLELDEIFKKKICCKRRTFLRGILSSEEQQDEERIKFG
jgi:hypothetical protein